MSNDIPINTLTLNISHIPTKLNISNQDNKAITSYTIKDDKLYNDDGDELSLVLTKTVNSQDDKAYRIDSKGNKKWYKHGKLHRDNDLPAIENANGEKEWYIDGKRHRDNAKPACEYQTSKWWYKNDSLNRDNDLPSVEYDNGCKYWHKDNIHHRDNDLPASEYNNSKMWYKDGKIHRDNDKPAVQLYNDDKDHIQYWPYGTIKYYYVEQWYRNDQYHRDGNKPAVIYYDKDMKIICLEIRKDGELMNMITL
jgi:hypothetical protein